MAGNTSQGDAKKHQQPRPLPSRWPMFLQTSLKRPIVAVGERVSNKESPQSPCLMAGMAMKEFHVPAGGAVALLALVLGFASTANAQQATTKPVPAPSPRMGFPAAPSRASAPPPAAKY